MVTDCVLKKKGNHSLTLDQTLPTGPTVLSCVQVIEFDDGSGSVLRIQPLRTHRDEAIYECTATNSVGEINTSAKLTVLEGEIPHLCSATQVILNNVSVRQR